MISFLEERYGIDLRSLAAMRIAVALCVLLDLLSRARDLSAHYTDSGVLLRSDYLHLTFASFPFNLSLIGGAWWAQALLFLSCAFAAMSMLLGYRTRLSTFVTWLLIASIQLRLPFIANNGDTLLRLLLLWGCLLPLGATYSIDAALSEPVQRPTTRHHLSVASIGLWVQISLVLAIAGYSMWSTQMWRMGDGVADALNQELLVTRFGLWLRQFTSLCWGLSTLVPATMTIGTLALFVPLAITPLRSVVLSVLTLTMLGFSLCLQVGLLPWVTVAGLLSFAPSGIWDRLQAYLAAPARRGMYLQVPAECRGCSAAARVFCEFVLLPQACTIDHGGAVGAASTHHWRVSNASGDEASGFDGLLMLLSASPWLAPLTRVLAVTEVRNFAVQLWSLLHRISMHLRHPQRRPTLEPWGLGLRELLATAFLGYVVLWNLGSYADLAYRPPQPLAAVGEVLRLEQRWALASFRLPATGWFSIQGLLANESQVELLAAGGPLPSMMRAQGATGHLLEHPPVVSNTIKDQRWLRFFANLVERTSQEQLLFYSRYLCRQWNAVHSGDYQLRGLAIVFMRREVAPETHKYENSDYERQVMWNQDCLGGTPG